MEHLIIKNITKILGISLTIFISYIFLGADTIQAKPEYIARFGRDCAACHEDPFVNNWVNPPLEGRKCTLQCTSCHVNPTGGGMRTEFGKYFAANKLSKNEISLFKSYKDVTQGKLGEFFSYGADFRFVYLNSQNESTRYLNTFFPMQTDIYLTISPIKDFTAYYQDGLNGQRDFFIMKKGLPYNSYIKFGRFIPPFGLKIDDHTSFTRDYLNLGHTTGHDVGIEAGTAPNIFFANAALINGEAELQSDTNKKKAFSATSGIMARYATIAGSIYLNDTESPANPNPRTQRLAGLYSILAVSNISLLAEYDITSNLENKNEDGSVSMTQITYFPAKGTLLSLKYDYKDPNNNIQKDEEKRYTVTCELTPNYYSQYSIRYIINKEIPQKKNNRLLLMAHFFY